MPRNMSFMLTTQQVQNRTKTVTRRLGCLRYAFRHGFKTSVSCEPYLDPYAIYTYSACKDYLTDSFWIGKIRGWHQVFLDDATPEQIKKYVDSLKGPKVMNVSKAWLKSCKVIRSSNGKIQSKRLLGHRCWIKP